MSNVNNIANNISCPNSGQHVDGESQQSSTGAHPAVSRGSVTTNLKSALRMLKEVGEMVPSVPYIKGISGIVLEILKVKDEVVMFKEKWQDIMNEINQIQSIVKYFEPFFEVHDGHQHDNAFVVAMQETLRDFEIMLKDVTETLIHCCAIHDSNNLATNTLQRDELCATIDKCSQTVKRAWSLFDMKLHLVIAQVSFANNHILQQRVPKNTKKERDIIPSSQTTNSSEQPFIMPTLPISEIPLREPDIFDGSKDKVDQFLRICSLWFSWSTSPLKNDKAKIYFARYYMQGKPKAWAQAYILENYRALSWEKFQKQFKDTFGDPSKKTKAYKILTTGQCQQGDKTIRQYNLQFNTLTQQAEFPNGPLICFYYKRGLNEKYWIGILHQLRDMPNHTRIQTLEEWQKKALEYEERYLDIMSIEERFRQTKSNKQGGQKSKRNTTNKRGRGQKNCRNNA